jgi:ribosomal protein S21
MKHKYKHLKQFSYSKSNLNVACWDIESWWTKLKREKINISTSQCMVDEDIPLNQFKYNEIEKVFREFKRKYSKMKTQESMVNNYDLYKDFWEDIDKRTLELTKQDWDALYREFKAKLELIVPNQAELANIIIDIVYNKNNGTYYKFAWHVAEEGILTNLRKNRIEPLMIPIETNSSNDYEYLGKYYKLEEYKGVF